VNDSAERIRRYYAERDRLGADRHDDPADPAYRFVIEGVERAVARALSAAPLAGYRILDAGCGDGHWLARLVRLGATPANLAGADLLQARTQAAAALDPQLGVATADLTRLPFRDAAFDLVTQFVVLSSIIEPAARAEAAREMLRVLRPGGILLAYDFILNPRNRHTRGLRRRDYQRLFPGCALRFERLTLVPPIARRVAPRAPWAAAALERLPFLRSHYLVVIRKP